MNDGPIVRRATPRAVLLDPLRNEWLDMGWQILQRVRPTNPGEIAEFHQRLNGLPDGALRGLPLAKPVDVTINRGPEPVGSDAVGSPWANIVTFQHG